MRKVLSEVAIFACFAVPALAVDRISWLPNLPVYDHIVIVVEENKDYEQIFGSRFDAPYIRKLAIGGASISRMFGEEHYSQGNYFWLFSGAIKMSGFPIKCPALPIIPIIRSWGTIWASN